MISFEIDLLVQSLWSKLTDCVGGCFISQIFDEDYIGTAFIWDASKVYDSAILHEVLDQVFGMHFSEIALDENRSSFLITNFCADWSFYIVNLNIGWCFNTFALNCGENFLFDFRLDRCFSLVEFLINQRSSWRRIQCFQFIFINLTLVSYLLRQVFQGFSKDSEIKRKWLNCLRFSGFFTSAELNPFQGQCWYWFPVCFCPAEEIILIFLEPFFQQSNFIDLIFSSFKKTQFNGRWINLNKGRGSLNLF